MSVLFLKKGSTLFSSVAGIIFFLEGGGKCPKVGHGPNILATHILSIVIFLTYSRQKGREEGHIEIFLSP